MKQEKRIGKVLDNFIERETKAMIKQCPAYAFSPSVIAYNESKNPSKDYKSYLEKTQEYFSDFCLRQQYFVCAKLSIRKYYPDKKHLIDPYYAEDLTKEKLQEIIKELN